MRPYGDRFDARIAELAQQGLSVPQIADALGISIAICRKRGYLLGYEAELRASGERRRLPEPGGPSRGRPAHVFKTCLVRRSDFDRRASDLVRLIRSRRPSVEVATDNALACLHQRGLALPDIEACFGIPPAQAAAAIRRAML